MGQGGALEIGVLLQKCLNYKLEMGSFWKMTITGKFEVKYYFMQLSGKLPNLYCLKYS